MILGKARDYVVHKDNP